MSPHSKLRLRRVLCALLISLPAFQAAAHSSSTSYLQLAAKQDALLGRWDIALRDLDEAVGLDADNDGQITWGEVRSAQARITGYALQRLAVTRAGSVCVLNLAALQITDHADGRYAALDLSGRCPETNGPLQVDYRLLFELDRQHRGLLNLQLDDNTFTAVLGPATSSASFGGANDASAWRVFKSYLREGLWHVWTGLDHLLFLAALFLPAVLRRTRDGWQVTEDLRAALWQTGTVVTAFTLAHATTLTLAALGWVHWPTRWVESAVAVTVAFAGLNNLLPMVHKRLALIAAFFGLIHGSAIAGALLDLGLPVRDRVWALAAFNLGVEAAQLLLVAIVVPVTYRFRNSVLYRHLVLLPGSALITLIGLAWFIERAFELRMLPF